MTPKPKPQTGAQVNWNSSSCKPDHCGTLKHHTRSCAVSYRCGWKDTSTKKKMRQRNYRVWIRVLARVIDFANVTTQNFFYCCAAGAKSFYAATIALFNATKTTLTEALSGEHPIVVRP
jgi:hypothetical protein